MVAQPNQDARPPDDVMQWPPSVITDFVYACAIVRKWGSKRSTQMLRDLTRDVYSKGHSSAPDIVSQKRQQSQKQSQARSDHLKERKGRGKEVENGDSHGMTLRREEQKPEMEEIMDWISFLWSRHANPCKTPQQHESSEGGEEKVREWLQTQL